MNNMNILHCAGSVVVYKVKLKPACPATGTSYKSEISGLASLVIEGSLTLAMGKCLWFSVKIKVCQLSLSSP